MSDPVVFPRRDFLKLVGLGVAATASGCGKPAQKLIPYLVAPLDVLPGVPQYFASTCRECPAGCGVIVKVREGRAIKLEGNPEHPVNRGGLCARGQASLQGLYDPDRLRTPMLKRNGLWTKIGWDEALQLAADKLAEAARTRHGVALVTDDATGSFQRLAAQWAAAMGGTHLAYEPFAHESLREANRRTFGVAAVPRLDFARPDVVVSFGADFLETWLSPVEHARQFAAQRARPHTRFIAVEPRLSLTGANADEWIAVRPGGEMALALGMAHVILTENLGPPIREGGALLDAVTAWTPEAVQQQTDVPADTVTRLAREFARRRPSLAVTGGVATRSEQSVALIAAVNLLNYAAGNVGETVRFDRTLNDQHVASFTDLQRLIASMNQGRVDVMVVSGANPSYAVPAWAGFNEAFDRVSFRISLGGVLDETAERCDLLLPAPHALESLGDAEPVRGVYGTIQPAMQPLPMFQTRPAGDTLIALAKRAGVGAVFPATWEAFMRAQWRPLQQRFGAGGDFESFWVGALQKGGVWEEVEATAVRWVSAPAFAAPELRGPGDAALVLFATPALYDGRGANKPWLQELPDPTTKAVWGSWVEIHPETAVRLGVKQGDAVRLESEAGSLELPAYLYAGVRKDTVAVPLGQGHTAYGRYAQGMGVNPLALLVPAQDAASGAVALFSVRVRLSKGQGKPMLALNQPDKRESFHEVGQVIPVAALLGAGAAEAAHGAAADSTGLESPMQSRPGRHTEPRQLAPGEKTPAHAVSAFVPEETVRSPRQIPATQGGYGAAQHRWAMAIDLNSCTGCSACVVACNAENNVPTVGPVMIQRGREMSWLRIERYEHAVGEGQSDVRFVPMLCQHCDNAPCETVCPVYATYHNPEGLNAQVYNRCVGTRYCSNNCPYKVRAFNWFDYAAPEKPTFAFPEPLNWQLNPDVTVRSKGVMEKCTMCIQRVLAVKGDARDAGRPVRDGDFQTACSQSCPTQAIVVGDLLDPDSKVTRLSNDSRHYWVLGELNTRPGVTYLKKIQRESA